MSEPVTVTDADRETAKRAFSEWVTFTAGDGHRSIGQATDQERIDAIAAVLADARAEADQLRDAMRALAAELAGRGQAELSHPMFAGEGKLLMEIAARVLNLSSVRDLADGGRR